MKCLLPMLIRRKASGAIYRRKREALLRRESLPLLREAEIHETPLSAAEIEHGIVAGLIRAQLTEHPPARRTSSC